MHSRSSAVSGVVIGVAAGLVGCGAMLLVRQFDRKYAPKTIPRIRKKAPPHMDPVTRQPLSTYSLVSDAPVPIAPIVCGVIAAGVYGLARGRHEERSALADGMLLGACTYAAGAFAIMPALGSAPPPWRQPFPALGGALLRHVVFGIATAATYGIIDDAC
jgi:uncharacterized membrane protein YagU involved in acid resistance